VTDKAKKKLPGLRHRLRLLFESSLTLLLRYKAILYRTPLPVPSRISTYGKESRTLFSLVTAGHADAQQAPVASSHAYNKELKFEIQSIQKNNSSMTYKI
jgi:hypothetical protein